MAGVIAALYICAIGIWTVVFTFVWASTAVYFAWPAPFERAIAAVSPITTANYPEQEMERIEHRTLVAPHAPFNVEATLRNAAAAVPGTRLEGFFLGSGQAPVFTVYMTHGRMGDYANTDFLYFDQRTGELLLVWRRGENHTLGDWILWLAVPLHYGTSFGMAGKIVWAAAGLSLLLLSVSGLLMYWNRWLGKWILAPTPRQNRDIPRSQTDI